MPVDLVAACGAVVQVHVEDLAGQWTSSVPMQTWPRTSVRHSVKSRAVPLACGEEVDNITTVFI